jgi:hypothetical protein
VLPFKRGGLKTGPRLTGVGFSIRTSILTRLALAREVFGRKQWIFTKTDTAIDPFSLPHADVRIAALFYADI